MLYRNKTNLYYSEEDKQLNVCFQGTEPDITYITYYVPNYMVYFPSIFSDECYHSKAKTFFKKTHGVHFHKWWLSRKWHTNLILLNLHCRYWDVYHLIAGTICWQLQSQKYYFGIARGGHAGNWQPYWIYHILISNHSMKLHFIDINTGNFRQQIIVFDCLLSLSKQMIAF